MGENILEKVKQLETLFSKYEITGRELMQVRTLAEKIEKQEMTVSVIGQFKRGKSTLVNGILGDKVMPVGIVPVTAVVTTVKYGEEKTARVHFENGAVVTCGFDDIGGYINEQENQDNRLGVSRVELSVPANFLKTGITPGGHAGRGLGPSEKLRRSIRLREGERCGDLSAVGGQPHQPDRD